MAVLRVLFLADPLDKLKPLSDTTLALAQAHGRRKHRGSFATENDLVFLNGKLVVQAQEISGSFPDGSLPTLQKKEVRPLSDFSVVWIRKDPPFDSSYLRLCWLLALEENRVTFLNRPSVLLRYHEKLLPWEGFAQGYYEKKHLIDSFHGETSVLKTYVKKASIPRWIQKPFFGYGGGNIFKETKESLLQKESFQDSLIQPFQENIADVGDRRVFFLGGRYVGDILRLPKPGGYVSNLSQGGSAAKRPVSEKEKLAIQKLGKFLKKIRVDFAGADLIGDKISEVNITSPMGVRSYAQLYGKKLEDEIAAYAENLAVSKKSPKRLKSH